MCTNDFASEDPKNGGISVDSVVLRVMTQQDGCTCEVSLQNHFNTYTVYMRIYELLRSAAPEREACGLAIDVDYTSPKNIPENKDTIECTKGIDTRSVSLSPNGVQHLRSRIIGGVFSRGYCLQIYRQHTTGDKIGIQMNCSLPYMQTTQQDKTDSSNIQTTQQMTDVAIHDSAVSDNGNVRTVIIIVAVIGWCLTALFAITTVCLYRRIYKQRSSDSGEPNGNAQYQDLHVTRLSSCYSSLNASSIHSEQDEHM
ncbi:uncharacterized protein LOC134686480 [Mytilus trossulus]|uniref:uncharacterized protein LOC134686480 n=1 Tax=Mytilus trossulus TaxID=6551 RepID=UPI003007A1DF